MKRSLIFTLLFIYCHTGLAQNNDGIELKTVKEWVLNNKIGTPVHYHFAYWVNQDFTSKQGKSWLKDIEKNSGFKWNYISMSPNRGSIVVPSVLFSDFNSFGNNNTVEFNATKFQKYAIRKFLPAYIEEQALLYDVSLSQFIEFQEFVDSYKAETLPFLFKNDQDLLNQEIPKIDRKSEKIYPYYGKISIKLKDSHNKEVDSYGYIYQTDTERKPWGEEVVKEFKANVRTSAEVAYYDIYCDGKKVSSPTYTTSRYNVTSFESKPGNEGIGFTTTLLQAAFTTYLKKAELSRYQDEIFRVAQQKTCFYQGDYSKKTEKSSLEYLDQARSAFNKGNYYEAVQKCNASLWSQENYSALELRGEIMERFNVTDQALNSYLEAVKISKNLGSGATELGGIYYKIALCISKLQNPTEIKLESNKVVLIDPQLAVQYLKKAADRGYAPAKAILTKTPENLK
jgi:hypothetical protein